MSILTILYMSLLWGAIRKNFLRHWPQLLPLLQAASQRRKDLELAAFAEAQVRWALETGLGPLLFQATQGNPRAALSPLWPLLRGADLTAQVLAAEHFDAMSEILDAWVIGPLVALFLAIWLLVPQTEVYSQNYPPGSTGETGPGSESPGPSERPNDQRQQP